MAENSAARFDWVHGPFKVKSKKGRTVFSYLATDAITGDPQKLTLVMLNDGRQTASAALAHGKFAKEVLTYKNDMLFPSAGRRGPLGVWPGGRRDSRQRRVLLAGKAFQLTM